MNGEYIKFGSVTTAQKAQSVLAGNAIRSRVGKNPEPKKNEGCGYALFVDGSVQQANEILLKKGITSKGIKAKNN